MTRTAKVAAVLLAVCLSGILMGAGLIPPGRKGGGQADRPLRFTILYDNYVYRDGTEADWGFSCLIEGTKKTILFDAGTKPRVLARNIEAMNVDPKKIDLVVISHDHGDHTGGLASVLEKNPGIEVFYPLSFPSEISRRLDGLRAVGRSVDKPVELCRNVHLTGPMGDSIKEQSLIIDTPRGLIIITGCAHQGILNVLTRARQIVDKPIHMVFGGFHLGGVSDFGMRKIIAGFKEMNVEKCGATHCTGDGPISAFKQAFGDNFLPMGTGRVIEVH